MSTNLSKDTSGIQEGIPAASSSRHPERWGMVLWHCFPPGSLEEVKEKSGIATLTTPLMHFFAPNSPFFPF